MQGENGMKSCKYLYDCNGEDFAVMTYEDALLYKISCAKDLVSELSDVAFKDRDTKRINDVLKAIEFNKQLLKEIEG